tara:strand:+ start:122 stop:901 length:780 start_codon:yes stop_codon:yes gene_type:complete
MEDHIRLFISNDRLKSSTNNRLKLTDKESHYISKVMRLKNGYKISIVNGEGALWIGTKLDGENIQISSFDKPNFFKENNKLLIGLAISPPKRGFEDILKMTTEIGIDFIQPLISERQIKKISNQSLKMGRWDSIINESVEQSERLWKPKLYNFIDLYDWINSINKNDFVSISVTRNETTIGLRKWISNKKFIKGKTFIIWNVIGPEGGWSKNEIEKFRNLKIQFIKLSDNILRTSTAAINAVSLLSECRAEVMSSINYW